MGLWLPLARPPLGTWPATQACALTRNRTSEPLVCRLVLSPDTHQLGHTFLFGIFKIKEIHKNLLQYLYFNSFLFSFSEVMLCMSS